MQYPCIRYTVDNEDARHANNSPYTRQKRYLVTVITSEPDSEIPDAVASLPTARFSRRYVVNNLYHTAYNLYF